MISGLAPFEALFLIILEGSQAINQHKIITPKLTVKP